MLNDLKKISFKAYSHLKEYLESVLYLNVLFSAFSYCTGHGNTGLLNNHPEGQMFWLTSKKSVISFTVSPLSFEISNNLWAR